MAIQEAHNDTVLGEILEPLIRQWKLLIIGVLAGLVAASVFIGASKTYYETSFLLQIGTVSNAYLEDPISLAIFINSDQFHQTIASKLAIQMSPEELRKMIRAETENFKTSIVVIFTRAEQPEQAVHIAQAVSNEILEQHANLFRDQLAPSIAYKRSLEASIKRYNGEIEELQKDVEKIKSKDETSLALIVQTKLAQQETQLMKSEKELHHLADSLLKPDTQETMLLFPATLSAKSVNRNFVIKLVFSGFASLVIVVSIILGYDQYKALKTGWDLRLHHG
jgi:hypothetical protein